MIPAMADAALACRSLTVGYGRAPVLDSLDLVVAPGETVALLGPSGSGKTTLLYAVAGFVRPTAGSITVAGREVAGGGRDLPPEDRDIGFVFQHYALWPHLSAFETVAYPLRRSGLSAREARRRALELLDTMGMAALAGRRPSELSGGQQQRVGLARALARDAALYLFDEPTAHLDTTLRTALQTEVAERRRASGAAAVYATHDAGEALAVADRVAILRRGVVVQVGTPVEVYERPVDLWAARLTGPASILDGEIVGCDGAAVEVAGGRLALPDDHPPPGPVGALVRPDWAALGGPLDGVVVEVWYRGPHTDYRLTTASGEVIVRGAGRPDARVGRRVGWRLAHVHLLPDPAPRPVDPQPSAVVGHEQGGTG